MSRSSRRDAPGAARRFAFATAAAVLLAGPASAQGSRADYERAANLRQRFQGLLEGGELRPQWLDGRRLWYERQTAGGDLEVVCVDARADDPASRRRRLFDGAELAEAAGAEAPLRVARLAWDGGPKLHLLTRGDAGVLAWNLADGSAEQLAADAEPDFLLQPLSRPRDSGGRGAESGVLFVNRSDTALSLTWITGDGGRRDYGQVPPRGRRWQHTFDGHVWVLTAPDGEVAGVWRAAATPGIALVTAQGTVTTQDTVTAQGIETRGDGGRQATGSRRPERRRGRRQRGGATSPDGRFTASFRDHDLWLDTAGDAAEPRRVTDDGSAADSYGGPLFWSADGSRLVCLRTAAPQRHPVHVVESSPRDQVQPELVTYNYLKPGDRIARPRPQLFRVATDGSTERIAIDTALCQNPWRLSHWELDAAGEELRFVHNQRGHRVMRVLGLDLQSGALRAIVDEQPETFFDYAHKFHLRWLDGGASLLWMSERSGFNHLYRIDAATGEVVNAVTRGDWPVFDVGHFDAESGEVEFTAGGVYPDQDPYHVHHGRVSVDGGEITWLTEADGSHELTFSPDRSHYLDRYSRVDLPPVIELRRSADGALVCELERADDSALRAAGWRPPQRFTAKGRDGETDIWGIAYRPTNFDATRRYPVIESIYAGPHSAHVPKRFRVHHRNMELAELGFVVVRIDGMGTSQRSKAFHDVAWKNLGDAGFPDRIAWLRALAATDPAVDVSRVGIFGGSAGGQNAMRALIAHHDFYDAAAADCGCHDNRMDKIWWNELWMSWPVGEHYIEASNVEQAHRMQGHLLLTVGELDRNVDPASTMQVVDALIRADKDFELIVFPGRGHGAGGSSYGVRRRRDFFVRHLHGREPRWSADD